MYPKRFVGVLSLVLAISGRTLAEEKKVNVAVVDLASIFEKYAMTKDLEAAFDARRRAAAEEAANKKTAIDKKREALLARKPESKEFAELEQEVTHLEVEYEVWASVQEKSLKADHKRWLMRIYNNVREAVAEVAAPAHVDLVLTYDKLTEEAPDSIALRQQILLQKIIYFDDRIDLTQAVLTRLNEKYEKAGGAAGLKLTMASPLDELRDAAGEQLFSAAPGQDDRAQSDDPPLDRDGSQSNRGLAVSWR
jgi:Skp family chaperone for outer membrane proteins